MPIYACIISVYFHTSVIMPVCLYISVSICMCMCMCMRMCMCMCRCRCRCMCMCMCMCMCVCMYVRKYVCMYVWCMYGVCLLINKSKQKATTRKATFFQAREDIDDMGPAHGWSRSHPGPGRRGPRKTLCGFDVLGIRAWLGAFSGCRVYDLRCGVPGRRGWAVLEELL